jgi:hypothetical protein
MARAGNCITQVINKQTEKQRSQNSYLKNICTSVDEEKFEKHGPEIVNWLGCYETSLHDHQEDQEH